MKKVTSFALALVLSLGLTSCGGNSSNDQSSAPNGSASTPTGAQTDATNRIGIAAPQTGTSAAYGQLMDVAVSVGSYVEEGDILGYVAAPTKYYTLEGTNLYFALTKDGEPVNPEVLFR